MLLLVEKLCNIMRLLRRRVCALASEKVFASLISLQAIISVVIVGKLVVWRLNDLLLCVATVTERNCRISYCTTAKGCRWGVANASSRRRRGNLVLVCAFLFPEFGPSVLKPNLRVKLLAEEV